MFFLLFALLVSTRPITLHTLHLGNTTNCKTIIFCVYSTARDT